jgi:hypothetical protein
MSTPILNQDLIQKRKSVIRNMANSYATSIQTQIHKSCTKSINQEVINIINCSPPGSASGTGKCNKCSGVCDCCVCSVYPENQGDNPSKSIISQLTGKDGLCYNQCNCVEDNVSINNYLNVDASCKISDIDTDKIVSDIQNNLNKFVDETINDVKSDILKIVTNINDTVTNSINQEIQQTQVINIQGSGSMTNVTVSAVSDIILKAMESVDSTQNVADAVVDKLISQIKQEVNQKVVTSLKTIFNNSKNYFIITGSILGFSILLIAVLLVIRAFHSKK